MKFLPFSSSVALSFLLGNSAMAAESADFILIDNNLTETQQSTQTIDGDEIQAYEEANLIEIQKIGESADFIEASSYCGNSQIETPEVCDTNNFAGKTCSSYGYDTGFLQCLNTCQTISTQYCKNNPTPTPTPIATTIPSTGGGGGGYIPPPTTQVTPTPTPTLSPTETPVPATPVPEITQTPTATPYIPQIPTATAEATRTPAPTTPPPTPTIFLPPPTSPSYTVAPYITTPTQITTGNTLQKPLVTEEERESTIGDNNEHTIENNSENNTGQNIINIGSNTQENDPFHNSAENTGEHNPNINSTERNQTQHQTLQEKAYSIYSEYKHKIPCWIWILIAFILGCLTRFIGRRKKEETLTYSENLANQAQKLKKSF